MEKLSKDKFQVDQKVYLLKLQNHYDPSKADDVINIGIVRAVGTRYLFVDYCGILKFDMTDEFTQKNPFCSSSYALFLTKEDAVQYLETAQDHEIVINKGNRLIRFLPKSVSQKIKTILQKDKGDRQ